MFESVALAAVFVVWTFVKERSIKEEREAWTSERREFLNRIQHPEALILPPSEHTFEAPEPDEFGLVGAVIDE